MAGHGHMMTLKDVLARVQRFARSPLEAQREVRQRMLGVCCCLLLSYPPAVGSVGFAGSPTFLFVVFLDTCAFTRAPTVRVLGTNRVRGSSSPCRFGCAKSCHSPTFWLRRPPQAVAVLECVREAIEAEGIEATETAYFAMLVCSVRLIRQ